MRPWIVNARMYSLAPGAARAWRQLLQAAVERSGISANIIDHTYPAPLWELWRREDLACTLMCGWPFGIDGMRKKLVVAPVPADPENGGRPHYRSLFVVRRDSHFLRLEDTFGHRLGFTVKDSHSGYNAPRRHLAPHAAARGKPLFAEVIGNIPTPRLMIEAVRDGRVDVGPIDSFAFALLSRHGRELAEAVRVIDATAYATVPPFVASPACPDDVVERLAAALLESAAEPETAGLLQDLCILGFAKVQPEDYRTHMQWAQEAAEAGYHAIA